jgi:hypothetical protein
MLKLTPETIERINRIIGEHKKAQSQSAGASVSFHEKLAVLTAGSLALAVSGAGALYQKPMSDVAATHYLLYSLMISVMCLWLSLAASIVHNFLESYALHLDSEVAFNESSVNLFGLVLEMDNIKRMEGDISQVKEMVESGLKAKQLRDVQRAALLRKSELPVSIAAVSLFALGYLPVVGYVIVLARNFR